MPNQKPSKLELYIEILRSLEKLQSSSFLTIQEATNVEKVFLKRAMEFLESQNLVRKENVEDQTIYTATPRGERVSKYFTGPQEESDEKPITSFA